MIYGHVVRVAVSYIDDQISGGHTFVCLSSGCESSRPPIDDTYLEYI